MRGNVLVHVKVAALGLNAMQWAVISWAQSQKERETVSDRKYIFRYGHSPSLAFAGPVTLPCSNMLQHAWVASHAILQRPRDDAAGVSCSCKGAICLGLHVPQPWLQACTGAGHHAQRTQVKPTVASLLSAFVC